MKPSTGAPGKRRNKQERSAHRDYISRMTLKGYSLAEIAANLDLSVPQVWYDFQEVKKGWQKRADRNMEELENQAMERYKMIEREAWDAWTKSLEDQRIRIIKQMREEGRDSDKQYVEQRIAAQTGDPRYLQILLKTIADRHDFLGIPDHTAVQQAAQQVMAEELLKAYRSMAEREGLTAEDSPRGIATPPKSNGKTGQDSQDLDGLLEDM